MKVLVILGSCQKWNIVDASNFVRINFRIAVNFTYE